MNITLSLDDELAETIHKIAANRGTTLTSLVRQYLEDLVGEDSGGGREHREREALEQTFQKFQFKIGERNWTREQLNANLR